MEREFVDREYGEWYTIVGADGTIKDARKGSPSKGPYHVMQGLYHAHRNLEFARGALQEAGGARRWDDYCL